MINYGQTTILPDFRIGHLAINVAAGKKERFFFQITHTHSHIFFTEERILGGGH
jgi:hypothetical protein